MSRAKSIKLKIFYNLKKKPFCFILMGKSAQWATGRFLQFYRCKDFYSLKSNADRFLSVVTAAFLCHVKINGDILFKFFCLYWDITRIKCDLFTLRKKDFHHSGRLKNNDAHNEKWIWQPCFKHCWFFFNIIYQPQLVRDLLCCIILQDNKIFLKKRLTMLTFSLISFAWCSVWLMSAKHGF